MRHLRWIAALALVAGLLWLVWDARQSTEGDVDDRSPQQPSDQPAFTPQSMPLALQTELEKHYSALMANGDLDAIRQQLAQLLKQYPESAEAHAMMAMTYHREKRYALARPHFERAIEADPSYAASYHFLGYALYYLGELEAARDAFERHLARSREPEGTTIFGLGLIDLDEGRLDDAERRFREAIRLQEHRPERAKDVAAAHARLGDVHMRRGEFNKAEAELLHAIRIFPDLYGAYFKLHQVYLRLGNDEAAARAFRRFKEVESRVRPSEVPE